ncbi:MAG TPA: hypothetical protein PKW95_06635 [bacterium]|nr:hypothetical protein [bacterium]
MEGFVILGFDPGIQDSFNAVRGAAYLFIRSGRKDLSSSGLTRGSGDDRQEALKNKRQRVTNNHFPMEAIHGRSQILKQVQDDIAL